MTLSALALLLDYFRKQKEEISKIYAEIKISKEKMGKKEIVYTAYLLHNLYCASEDLFKEVAKTFENQFNDSTQYHKELLKKMTLSAVGIRPPLLSRESYLVLDDLRAFRHVFRHGYTYELEGEKILILKKKLSKYFHKIIEDFNKFEKFLESRLASGMKS